MRPVFENGAPVPAFLNKLWQMVDDEKTDNLISWSPGGNSFIIKHQGDFCTKLLPQFYKHSNMASFVRQLNMYGFHKVSSIENGIHKGEREEIEFIHLYFKKGEPTLVEKIKRKMSSRIPNFETKNNEMMNQVLKDVAQMRGRQLSLSAQLATIKQQNVALWRELTLLRRKHHKQTQIVNKLIQFLISLVHPSRNNINGLGVKRRCPLMINDIAQNIGTKAKKISRTSESPGPTIHELDTTDNTLFEQAGMLEDYIEPVIELHSPESQRTQSSTNSSNSKNASPVLLDNDDSNDEECSLSPELLFATNPNLVITSTQAMQTQLLQQQQQKQHKQIKSKAKNNKKQEQKSKKRIISGDDNLLDDLNDDSTIIDAIIQPNNSDDNNIQTIKVSPGDANILKAAAQEFGLIISNDENSQHGETISLENDGSQMDLNELLQSNDVSPIKCESDDTVLNEGDASKTVSSIEPGTSSSSTNEYLQSSADILINGDEMLNNRALATVQLPDIGQLNTASEIDTHLDTMQTELDSLKDLLVGEGYSIDANALLGLFGSDDPMSYTLPLTSEYENQEISHNATTNGQNNPSRQTNSDPILSGSELMCTPTFDFDMFSTPDNTLITTPENSMDHFDIQNLQSNDNLTNNCDSPLTPNFSVDFEK